MTATGPWERAPGGLAVLDGTGTLVAANALLRSWTGREDLVGLRFPDLLSVGGRIYWETHLGPLLHLEGRLEEVALELRGADGRVPVLLSAVADGERTQVLLAPSRERARYERELLAAQTDAARTAARLTALQETTAAVSGALGVQGVLDALLHAAAGTLGGAAATVWARGEDDRLTVRGAVREEPATLPTSGLLLQEGTATWYADRVVVPLHGRTALQGVLSVAPSTAAGADPLDLELLTAVGQQGGLALDRAVLYEQSASVAHQLQQSLLDVDPPEDPRFGVAAAYRPGVELLEVGGDFYDVFLVDEGVLAVVVGDVVGRGLGAASAMGQLRSAVRAVAGPDVGPARLLSRLDRFVEQVAAAGLSTLAYAELELATGRLRYACAGHPPPMLLSVDRPAEVLWGGRSTPLGAYAARRDGAEDREEAELQLSSGDRLLLYTDGLVERRDRALDDALAGLATEAARLSAGEELGPAVRRLTETMLRDEKGRDDVCVLLLSWHGRRSEHEFVREVTADLGTLSAVRRELAEWLVGHGVDPVVTDDLVLAVSEAIANAAEHGSTPAGRVALQASLEPRDGGPQLRDVVARVSDHGRWRTPTASPERGRGLTIMGALVDEVVVEVGEGTTVVLRRRVA